MLFEVWAPEADSVGLRLAGALRPMTRDGVRTGWWTADAEAADGDRYGFVLDDGPVLPDPRSRRQPDGPDGESAVVDQGRTPGAPRGRDAGCRAPSCTSCTSVRTPGRAPSTPPRRACRTSPSWASRMCP